MVYNDLLFVFLDTADATFEYLFLHPVTALFHGFLVFDR